MKRHLKWRSLIASRLARHSITHLSRLPEGDSYLGFIFARGETPAAVEQALRDAHARLAFTIDPIIELTVA